MAEEFATSRKKCVRCSTPVFTVRLDVSPAVGAQMMILLRCESIPERNKQPVAMTLCASLECRRRDSEISAVYGLSQSLSSRCIRG